MTAANASAAGAPLGPDTAPHIGDGGDAELIERLRGARHRVDEVLTMIESDRSCVDVVGELAAASQALNRAAYTLIATSMRVCLHTDAADRDTTPEQLEELLIRLI